MTINGMAWQISRHVKCDGTARIHIDDSFTFAQVRELLAALASFVDAQEEPAALPPPPRPSTTTSERAAALLLTASEVLTGVPGQVVDFCRQYGVDFDTPRNMAVAALGMVSYVAEGVDIRIADDVPEGD